MKILIFTEGTILMPLLAKGMQREEIVRENLAANKIFHDFENYLPIGNAVNKINGWYEQNADIYYLTSRTSLSEIDIIKNLLDKYEFPLTKNLMYRENGEEYQDVAERLLPNILIEDDCESIGGEKEMTITNIDPKIRKGIKSIVISEFEGIDFLPDNIEDLIQFRFWRT